MNRRSLCAAGAAILLSACASAPEGSSKTMPGADLAAYRSYAWISNAPAAGMSQAVFDQIRGGIDQALTAKGYVKGDPADMSLVLTIGTGSRMDVASTGAYGPQVSVFRSTQGRLSVDIFDTRTKQPLWHGEATRTIEPGATDPTVIASAVSGIMAKMPGRG